MSYTCNTAATVKAGPPYGFLKDFSADFRNHKDFQGYRSSDERGSVRPLPPDVPRNRLSLAPRCLAQRRCHIDLQQQQQQPNKQDYSQSAGEEFMNTASPNNLHAKDPVARRGTDQGCYTRERAPTQST